MSDRVTQWLDQLGLGQYAEAFEENAIELEHLGELDHETLKEIGVSAVGHRFADFPSKRLGQAPRQWHGPAS